jgi:hypothetical protein
MLMALHLYKWLILCGSLFTGTAKPSPSPVAYHPLYVSVTEINYNATDKNLEISCKIFTDDFEKTLGTLHNKKVDLFTPKDKAEADRQVSEYVRKRLVIKLDGKEIPFEFVGFERENDAVWSYFQAASATAPKKVEVSNSILYEAYEKQLNLMHVSVGGTRKSTRLNYPDKEAKFEF